MSPELQPMAVQYYCHVAPSILRDQYTALSLEGVLDVYLTCIRSGKFMSISRDRNIR